MYYKISSMKLLLFSLILGQVFAGPDEVLVDRILSAYIDTNNPKNVTVPNLIYPSEIGIGPLTSSVNVLFDKGRLEVSTLFRTGPVSNNGTLSFTGQIDATFSFVYDFRDSVPLPYSLGKTTIIWNVPVTMGVDMNDNKASLVSCELLLNSTLVADFIPFHTARSATLYPRDNCLFASMLYQLLKSYLDQTFKNILV